MADPTLADPTLVEALRAAAGEGDHVATHSEGCWRWHQRCAISLAADRLEAAEEMLRAYRDQGAPGRVGRAILDAFLAADGGGAATRVGAEDA